MTFKFYHYIYNKKFINKAPYLTDPKTLTTDKVAGDQDLENPVLTITSTGTTEVASYNYCYIQDWDRYYFIVKRNWLASNVMQIWLQEDYRYTAKTLIQAQTGLCRYSGLGNTNLIDGRVTFKPEAKIEEFPVLAVSQGSIPYWYAIKFISENPFENLTTGNCTVNVALLNGEAFRAFAQAYKNLTESSRVLVAKCIISVNRVRYVNPHSGTPGLGSSVASIRFENPYAENGQTSATIIWPLTTYPDAKCYILTSPEEVTWLDPVELQVFQADQTTVKEFNKNSRFWELNAQYLIKLPDLNPIEFAPASFGLTSNFRIYLAVVYEPFSENIVITFRKYNSASSDPYDIPYGYTPIVQHCQTSVGFITDTGLDMFAEQWQANELRQTSQIIGGTMSIVGGIVGAVSGSNPLGAVGGLVGGATGLMTAGINADMTRKQLRISEFLSMGIVGNTNGSISWTKDVMMDDLKCIVISQQPVSTPWGYKGIPDGEWRSLFALDQSGYAEIDVDEIVGNNYNYTDNELENIKAVLSEGVIFNEIP